MKHALFSRMCIQMSALLAFCTAFLGVIGSSSQGAVLYDEAIRGDFSDGYQAPTILTVLEGSNEISGSLSGGGGDLDFFTLIVPPDFEISALNVLAYTSSVSTNSSFMGLQPGATLSASPFEIEMNEQIPINYLLFSAALIDDSGNPSILGRLTAGRPLMGVDVLEEGSYAFWLNETGAGADWTLEFVATAVPEPSSISLVFLVAVPIFFCRHRLQH